MCFVFPDVENDTNTSHEDELEASSRHLQNCTDFPPSERLFELDSCPTGTIIFIFTTDMHIMSQSLIISIRTFAKCSLMMS